MQNDKYKCNALFINDDFVYEYYRKTTELVPRTPLQTRVNGSDV